MTDHGARLTADEYQERICSLYETSNLGSVKGRYLAAKSEFSLSIDFRLGVDFPQDRRDQLWNAKLLCQVRLLPASTFKLVLSDEEYECFFAGMEEQDEH